MSPLLLLSIGPILIVTLYLTRVRRFYLLRHGETILNEQNIRQGAEGGLSEKGKKQASVVGAYLKAQPIDLIISSTFPRALETAQIIQQYIPVPILSSPLLVERRNPSAVIGKRTDDPVVRDITNHIDLAYHDNDYRYSDEENFADLRERARKCLDLLAHQGGRATIIVTHHVFLKMLVAYLLYRENFTASDFVKLSFFNKSDNASITVCEYNPWAMFGATRGWSVITYNEQAK